MKKYYTIYNGHDEIIAAGTVDQCIETLGMKRGSFFSMISKIKAENDKYRNWGVVIEIPGKDADIDSDFEGEE